MWRAALIGGLLTATESDLHRQVGDHQVHHPEADHADAAKSLSRLAAFGS